MQVRIRRGRSDEAEKPFWISFSDLMSAMAVLFLIVMSVALIAVTKTVKAPTPTATERDQAIQKILRELGAEVSKVNGAHFDKNRYAIDLGDSFYFRSGDDGFTPEQADAIRAFIVGKLLPIARSKEAQMWLNRIIVEGYTDRKGSYLSNLNLSLRRSQRVLCVLLTPGKGVPLDESDTKLIRERFLVGGYSSSLATKDDDASRKVEFRLEFRGITDTKKSSPDSIEGETGTCGLVS